MVPTRRGGYTLYIPIDGGQSIVPLEPSKDGQDQARPHSAAAR
jgi:hypothetical protein